MTNKKLYGLVAAFVVTATAAIVGIYRGEGYQQAQFNAVYAQDPENIVAVGKDFLGVVEKTEDMVLPSGYTFDMVHELGEIVFVDIADTITVTQQVPGNIKCYMEVTATPQGEQPTQTCTPEPVVTETPAPDIEIPVSISAIGRYVNGENKSACTRGLWVYSTALDTWGWAPNAHCVTKAVKNKYGNMAPAYLENAGEYISPSTLDGGIYPNDVIGMTSYWFPNKIGTSTMTNYDTGFVAAYDQDADHYVYDDELPQVTSIYQSVPDVGTIMIGEGRTTGVVRGKVVATGVSIYMSVGYDAVTVHYANQVIVEGYGGDTYVSKGGDSGKTWRFYSDQDQAVCQNWAGNTSGTYSVCSLWYRIFKGMHLSLTE